MSSETLANGNNAISLSVELIEKFNTASNLIKSTSSQVKVISHYDADGLSAGAILCAILIRLKKQFHIYLQHNLDPGSGIFSELKDSSNGLKIFSDMGSGRLDEIEGLDGNTIILDHHKPSRDTNAGSIIHINSHLFGINGSSEISASTLTFLLATTISHRNWDLIDIAMAGAMGDKQHKNGFKGINQQLISHAVDQGILEERFGLKLRGKNILEAIINSTDPYFLGLTNNKTVVIKLLESLEINPDDSIDKIDKDTKQRLVSYLILKLLEQGIPPEDAEELVTVQYFDKKHQFDLEELSHIINACGRLDRMGLGVAAGLGDEQALAMAKQLRADYKQKILVGLKKLETDGPSELKNIQYFHEPTVKFAGTFAGIGMMFFFNQAKPVITLTKTDKNIKVSGRGTIKLVNRGLDLATIFAKVSGELSGSGGGHQIAAGATLPLGVEEEFLNKVDDLVGEQLKLNGKD